MKRLIVIAALIAVAGDWPSLGPDSARTRTTAEVMTPPFATVWSTNVGATIVSSPAVADGVVVHGAADRRIRALRESDGALLWQFTTTDPFASTPAIAAGRVFAPCQNGQLYAFRITDGNLLWNASIGNSAFSSPTADGGAVYVGSSFPDGRVLALNASTGATIWSTTLDQLTYTSPAVAGGRVYAGTTRGRLHALNQATGAVDWTFDTTGRFMLSSPMVVGDSVYAFPGNPDATFYRVDTDPADWGTNWTLAIADPAAPPAIQITGQNVVTSSPVLAGTRLCAVVRFDYYRDTDGDFWDDTYTMNEYAVGITTAGALEWQVALGAVSSPDRNVFPLYGVCPTPAAAGSLLATASSIDPTLRVLDAAALGVMVASNVLDAPGRASPAAANARIYAATDAGSLYALESVVNGPPAPPASGFAPAGGIDTASPTPTISWDPAIDPNDGPANLRYVFRFDDDGEILQSWDVEITTSFGTTSVLVGPLAADTHVTWAVRTEDDDGARSAWSALQDFWVGQKPDSPDALLATPMNGAVKLDWDPSPSPVITSYQVRWGVAPGPTGAPVNVGLSLSYTVTGLTNGTPYLFEVTAIDGEGDESQPATATATPDASSPTVFLNGAPMVDLPAALALAGPGDVITLGPGTFAVAGGTTIADLTIVGTDALNTIVTSIPPGPVLTVTGNATIERLTITGGDSGVLVTGGVVLLQNVVLRDHPDAGVRVTGGTTTVNLATLANNAVVGLDALAGAVTLTNSIVTGSATGLNAAVAVAHEYNDYFGNGVDLAGDTLQVGEIPATVAFVDAAANDYREAAGSAAVDAGRPGDPYLNEPSPNGDRVNMGAFGNTSLAAASPSGASGASTGGGGGGGGCGLAVLPARDGSALLLSLSLAMVLTLAAARNRA